MLNAASQTPPETTGTRGWAGRRGPVGLVKPSGERLPTPSVNHRPRVLLATRQLQVRAIGTTVLQQAGFRVLTETRGEAIAAELDATRPDLILTDEQLEDMHAARLCTLVRQHSAGTTIPILVFSDLCHTPTLEGILSQDFTDFVSAPLNWKAVTFRIHRWIATARKFHTLSDHELDLEQVRDSALKASTELLQLRNYDPVTGLPNREMFLSAVELMLSRAERASGYCAVLYLDIDDFKGVNDVLGRARGDELLKIVAKRLQGCLREGDLVSQAAAEGSMTSFARLNGDQFAILLGSVADRDDAAGVACRLLESLSRPLKIQDRQFSLAARVGIAEASHDDVVEEEVLVQRAEIAMRYCKQQKGKTSAFFEGFMDELVQKRLEVKVELRRALDLGELFLCYQLLVDSRTSVPTGVEGLIRWQHPERGLVPPNEFLPVAEESDLIVEVDRWVLRVGCRQGKKWLDDGYPPLKISLNVSMRFLEQDDFARQVLAIVEETGLPPESLQLELSERGTLPDPGRIMAQFEMLVAAGVHLALDDFGTGQTSLSYLRTLPISCVKIDQSFVRRIPEDPASEAIVTAIAAMSHHLGLQVVAEGVETEEQWRFLAGKECNQLQGYLFSKPETVARLESKLLTHDGSEYAAAADPAALAPQKPELSTRLSGPALPARESVAGRHGLPGGQAEGREPADREPEGQEKEAACGDRGEARPATSAPRSRTEEEKWTVAGGASSRGDSDGYLMQLARKDFLTKLYNRFSFDERLEHALAHADRFDHNVALLLIDLDDFKYVNDTHGHAVGDGLLVSLADRLSHLVRKVDTVARLGGDEFAVILSEYHDLKNVTEFARRLLAVLSQPVDVEGRELRVTGSLGVTVYPSAGAQAKDLLRQADLALYKAKSHGGNSVRFFAPEMDREVQRRLALARDLNGAVERGELFLEYQLQVALSTGAIMGVEALLRWDHPSQGLIGPGRFIPIAESTGEIRPIGRWVIASACALAKRWQSRSDRGIPVAVNLSPVQCRDPGFVDSVMAALEEHDLPPGLLSLELNEQLLEQLPRTFEESLRRLSELGVSLTLDNFGSGSSALEYFQRFRFDRLKIHQSLVRRIGGHSVSASVLSGLVAMARKMGVQIVAEGVEEPEQREQLLAEGCEVGQGFLFGRPMPEDALAHLMTVAGDFAELAPDELEPPSRKIEAPAERAAMPGPEAAAPPEELLAPIPEEPAAESPSVPSAEPHIPPGSSALLELDRYAASAATFSAGVGKWRPHTFLAVAALAVWSFYFLSGPPRASGSTAPVGAVTTAEWPGAASRAAEPPAATAGPASRGTASAALPVAVSADQARQIVAVAQAWARAWSEQRVDAYLDFYAAEFQVPGELSRGEWEAQRRSRILGPRRIEVRLSAVETEASGARRARVSFDQSYTSDSYSDSTRKTLDLVKKDGGGWKILAERAEG